MWTKGVLDTEVAGTIQEGREERKKRRGSEKLLWSWRQKWSSNMPSGRAGISSINLDGIPKIIKRKSNCLKTRIYCSKK